MSDINISVTQDDLAKLTPSELQELMETAIFEATDIIADLLIDLIFPRLNVDTGAMRGSLRKEVIGRIISVVMGGEGYINPKTGKPVNYAPAQERINPTFEPALKMIESTYAQLIQQKITQKLEERGITVV